MLDSGPPRVGDAMRARVAETAAQGAPMFGVVVGVSALGQARTHVRLRAYVS